MLCFFYPPQKVYSSLAPPRRMVWFEWLIAVNQDWFPSTWSNSTYIDSYIIWIAWASVVSPSHADRTVQMYVGKYGDGLATSSLAALHLVEPLKIDGWYDERSLKIRVDIHQISGTKIHDPRQIGWWEKSWQTSDKLTTWGEGSLSHYLNGFIHPMWFEIAGFRTNHQQDNPLKIGGLGFIFVLYGLNFN